MNKTSLDAALDVAVRAGASYADIREVSRTVESISVRQGAVREISSSSHRGFGVRALVNGAWGFASSSKLDQEEIERVAGQAVAIARGPWARDNARICRAAGRQLPDAVPG